MAASASIVPPPEPGDTEDMTWALSTAQAMEARGDWSECVRWVRRAAEAASEASKNERALHLAKVAADLTTRLDNQETTDVGARVPEEVAPAPMTPKMPSPKRFSPPAKDAGRSKPPAAAVVGTARASVKAPPVGSVVGVGHSANPGIMRPRAPSTTEEWDAMPTQALSNEDLAHIARTDETSAISAEMRAAHEAAARPMQAVRVRIWSDGDGVHVAPATAHVSAPSVEAMLVALDSTDLTAWLRGASKPIR